MIVNNGEFASDLLVSHGIVTCRLVFRYLFSFFFLMGNFFFLFYSGLETDEVTDWAPEENCFYCNTKITDPVSS